MTRVPYKWLVAIAFGVAILGAVLFELLINKAHTITQSLSAYHIAFIAATALGLIAILFALTVHDKDAAASLKSKNIVSNE